MEHISSRVICSTNCPSTTIEMPIGINEPIAPTIDLTSRHMVISLEEDEKTIITQESKQNRKCIVLAIVQYFVILCIIGLSVSNFLEKWYKFADDNKILRNLFLASNLVICGFTLVLTGLTKYINKCNIKYTLLKCIKDLNGVCIPDFKKAIFQNINDTKYENEIDKMNLYLKFINLIKNKF